MSEVTGDTTWLHSTKADVRVLVSHTGTSHNEVVDLRSHARVVAHTASRGFARIAGPITVTVEGPASQSKATDCRVAVVPTSYTAALNTRGLVFGRPLACSVKSAIYLQTSTQSLRFPTSVDTQLQPALSFDNHPQVALSWVVDGGVVTDTVDVAIDFVIELAGVGYI